MPPSTAKILVCQSNSCRRRGSEALLLEIEELVTTTTSTNANPARVQGSGCLGLCNQAPAAVVVKQQPPTPRVRRPRPDAGEQYFTRIDSLQRSCDIVRAATGQEPDVTSPELQERLQGVRWMRARDFAKSVYRWNEALQCTTKVLRMRSRPRNEDVETHQALLQQAGGVLAANTSSSDGAVRMPTRIANYSQWTLEGVTPVSHHSAVLHFASQDPKRGTPNPRGGGRTPPAPKTWHTTLLAEVGSNAEGPLPWIERDYTPISGALQWERGICNILIKMYSDGSATSWLLGRIRSTEKPRIWLSQPVQTLSIPSLVPTTAGSAFKPASILLLLAGTGVVALPQILHHRDPNHKIGISMRWSDQMHVPVDLVLSCRNDDALMIPEILEYCRQNQETEPTTNNNRRRPQVPGGRGLRRCTVLLTGENVSQSNASFFEGVDSSSADQSLADLDQLPNAQVLQQRLNFELVEEAVSHMLSPCRVVVSGPSGFNAAVREMLQQANVDNESVTILEA